MIDSIFELDHPVLRESLQRAPETRIEWIQSDVVDGRTHVCLWLERGSEDAFEDAVIEDSTVSLVHTTKCGERRLYRFVLINDGAENDMYPRLVSEGGFIRRLTASPEGWRFHVLFPEYDAASRLFDFFLNHNLDFTVRRMVKDDSGSIDPEGGHAMRAEIHH